MTCRPDRRHRPEHERTGCRRCEPGGQPGAQTIVLNTLGDLTNRENRALLLAVRQRFRHARRERRRHQRQSAATRRPRRPCRRRQRRQRARLLPDALSGRIQSVQLTVTGHGHMDSDVRPGPATAVSGSYGNFRTNGILGFPVHLSRGVLEGASIVDGRVSAAGFTPHPRTLSYPRPAIARRLSLTRLR